MLLKFDLILKVPCDIAKMKKFLLFSGPPRVDLGLALALKKPH